jgi:hypothetical protein
MFFAGLLPISQINCRDKIGFCLAAWDAIFTGICAPSPNSPLTAPPDSPEKILHCPKTIFNALISLEIVAFSTAKQQFTSNFYLIIPIICLFSQTMI